jgi:uncharacterized protein (TIGR02996 family)
MSDEKALLAAIREHPHEDTPRLVYADWLQENGQPERGEFIRVQCELARLEPDDPRSEALTHREGALWRKHAKAWKAGLSKLLQVAPFHRGFPHPRRRAVTGSQFLKITSGDLAQAPLWDFRINQAQKTIVRVVASAAMARVGILELPAAEFMDRPVEVLAAANFRNVADLHLSANWIGEPGVAALVANASVRHLRVLTSYSSGLDDAAIARLVSAPWYTALRALAVGNNPFGPAGLRALVGAATGGALRELGVRGLLVSRVEKRFDEESLAVLFRAPHLVALSGLDLGANYLGDRVTELLCSERTTFRLRRLMLDNNSLTDAGAERLAAWPGLATVETLILSSNTIGPRGARALVQSPHLTRLRMLWLEANPLASARALLADRFGEALKFH